MLEVRKTALKALIKRLHDGATVAEVKDDFARDFGAISSKELSEVEQSLISDGMPVEEITRLCDVHAEVFAEQISDQPTPASQQAGHPAFVFVAENEGLTAFLSERLKPAVESEDATNVKALWHELQKLDRHYIRKETLLFPLLEKNGVTGPPKVMWNVDDEIRTALKAVAEKLEADTPIAALKEEINVALAQVESMITKENNILIPMLEQHIDADEWLLVAIDSPTIGYVFNGGIEGGSPSDAADWTRRHRGEEVEAKPSFDGQIVLPSGHFTVETLTAMLNSLPVDLTFVGEDDRVHFFSETPERIFARTRTIIGREVSNCHPPKSLHVVEKLVEDFKAGRRDSESFWIQQGDRFILIRYFAVRDNDGKYLGVVETTEDIAPLRKLEGQKTLLSE